MSASIGLLLLALGLVLIVGGAEVFLNGLLGWAARLRVAPFVLTVIISGFEVENVVAGVAANLRGLPDAAAGTFLGGTTFLALGVAGLGALISPIKAVLPRAVLAWTALSPVPLVLLSLDGTVSRLDGLLLLGWFSVALWGLWRSGRSVIGGDPLERTRHPVARALGGLALLSIGGEVFGRGIRSVVSGFGISESLLGNTVVAASVEAEEVGRVAVPAKRGRSDVALGNIVGTIAHFIAFNAGVIALVKPMDLGPLSLHLHLPVAAGSTAFLCGLLRWRGGLGRAEGFLLLALYVGYIASAIGLTVAA